MGPLPLQASHVEGRRRRCRETSGTRACDLHFVHGYVVRVGAGAASDEHPRIGVHFARDAVDDRADAASMLGGGGIDKNGHGKSHDITQ